MKKSFISSLSVYVATVIQMVFTFLTSVYVIRYLSVENYGAYKLIFSLLTFSTYFTSFGLENTLGRFVPEYLSKGNYRNVNHLLLLTILIRISAIFLFIVILVSFKHSIFSFLNFPSFLMTWLGVICVLIFLERTKGLFGEQFLASYLELYFAKINVIVISIIRFFLFLFVVYNNWGLEGLILSLLAVDMISFVYFLVLAAKKYNYNKVRYSSKSLINLDYKRISRFSLFSFLAVSTFVFREIMIDNFVISYYLDVSMVGLYSFAAVLVGIPRQLNPISILRGVFNPLLVKRYYEANEDKNVLIFFYRFFNKLFFFISLPMFIGLGILGEEIITLIYGTRYLQTLSIIYILLISYSIGFLSYTYTSIINVLEKNELFFYSGIFSVYNLVMDIILVAKFGIIGAAIATGSATVLSYFYFYYFVRKLTKINFIFPFKSLLNSLFNLLPMILFLLIFKKYIINIELLITAIVFSLIIYLLISFFNKLFSNEEREMINCAIGKNIWVF